MPQMFDELMESLLRAGIAPRHVKRYVHELRDHFEDLLREEIANGVPAADAEIVARRRLGSNEILADAMLQRPERSIMARFPVLVFGAGPVLALIALIFFGVVFEIILLSTHLAITHWLDPPTADVAITPPQWLSLTLGTLNGLLTYASPLIIAAVMYVLVQRQRMSLRWMMLAGAIIAVVGACHSVGIEWSNLPHQSELFVGFLSPEYSRAEIWACILRAAANLTLLCVAYWLWLRPMDRARRGSGSIDPAQGTDLA